jgi:hypothetical protein
MKGVIFCILLLLLIVPVWQWGAEIVQPRNLFTYQLPPGQWYYLLSKLLAQYAYAFLTAQVILGSSLVVFGNRTWLTVKLHRGIGICVLIAVFLHVGFFAYAVWLRSDHFPTALFTLRFDQGYYNFFISIGVIAAGLLIVAAVLGGARTSIPGFLFNYGHRIVWPAWLGAVWHSFAIGTETKGGVIWSLFYVLGVLLVSLLVFYRFFKWVQYRLAESSCADVPVRK